MRLKVIDAAWIADNALDRYAKETIDSESMRLSAERAYTPTFVSSSVSKTFELVCDDAVAAYSRNYDKVVVIVDCFPMMRIDGCPLMARYGCRHQDLLRAHGISPQQFLDLFERFVQRKCNCGAKTDDGILVWLKDKAVVFDEWKSAILGRFGSSLCDFEKDGAFAANPGFVYRAEPNGDIVKPLSSLGAFRIRKIVEKIA